jgi:hypothetical protein
VFHARKKKATTKSEKKNLSFFATKIIIKIITKINKQAKKASKAGVPKFERARVTLFLLLCVCVLHFLVVCQDLYLLLLLLCIQERILNFIFE